PTTLYAGTFGEGVLRSTDSGAHWSGLRTTISKEGVTSLVIDPLSRTILYAGTQDGIFRSRDSGATWTAVNTGLASKWILSLTIDPLTPTTLYACTETGGIFRSTNSGTTWTAVNNGIASESANCLVIDAVTPAILYVGCTGYVRAPGGIFRSTDSGTTWRAANAGITNTWVRRLAIDPLTPTTIYAVTDTDIRRSTDSGATWKGLNTADFIWGPYSAFNLVVDPCTPTTLYAQTSDNHNDCCILRSTDSGATWTGVSDVQSLAIDPVTPTILYGGTYGGVIRSTDSGATWTAVNADLAGEYIQFLVIDPVTTTTLYAGTQDCVFRSTDSGTTWTAVNAGLASTTVQFLVIDPLNPTILYADTDTGVFRSTDTGTTWRMVSTDLVKEKVTSLVIDPLAPTTLYASTGGSGVLCSTDSGTTWTAMNKNLTSLYACALAINPLAPSTVYVGTGSGGVFRYGAVPSYTLATTSSPASGGTIARSPDQSSYLSGTVVTLTARPATGYSFAGWSGDLSGTENLATITIDADKTVTANFTNPPAYTLTPSFGSGGTMTPNTRQTAAQDESTTFTITPNAGYHIADVTVDRISRGPVSSYAFTSVRADHVIQARFEPNRKETVIVLQIGKTTFTVSGSSKKLDSPPVIKNGRTLVPIRAIIEALGGTVGWDGTAGKATVNLGSTSLQLWIGKSRATVRGISTPIDSTNIKVVPEIISGRTMLPLRFVSENLGCSVIWTDATKTVTITYQQ
ncbi:MAG: stalk domain-containing protein, partial [Caldiserica bacterium]|nr:stalk domain-containing protein [Caldisericota bacterium]